MTQYFDFVALGWVEKYLREEMDAATRHLHSYEREPNELKHLEEALRNVHSATGVLRLCALDPAALLTEEIERVVGQLIQGGISGEARKLAMTELVAAIEALPAYLANVRAKREVSAGVIANVINDLRHFGNRPALPDSLFFNPSINPGAGITKGSKPAESEKLRQFGARAMKICYQDSKPALQRDHGALKRLYAVGKHATPMLAGSSMEPYFRCYMGLIEAMAQPYMKGDEVVVDIFKQTFVFLKALARNGLAAIDEANPTPAIKKMLYYIAKSPSPTRLQQTLRDTFGVHNVDEVRIESSGRLIQEDDLLEALKQTMSQLLEVMEFINKNNQEIFAKNKMLVGTIVPRLRQVSLQLKAIGLTTHSDTVAEQHATLQTLSQRDKPAMQNELLDFGGALVAVKESLEHKLKHGLSAHGDSMGHDLDSAVMEQTVHCLGDMKNSINRELSRKELTEFLAEMESDEDVSISRLRPLYRAAALVDDPELRDSMAAWDQGQLPSREALLETAKKLLSGLPAHAYAEQAAAQVEQVLSVLSLMEEKKREAGVLASCTQYIRDSVSMGGLVNDAGMACFAEAIAALEQYMERRAEDPLGNSDEHLDRAEARARMLASFIEQRSNAIPISGNMLDLGAGEDDAELERELVLSGEDAKIKPPQSREAWTMPGKTGDKASDAPLELLDHKSNVVQLRAALEQSQAAHASGKPAPASSRSMPWWDALGKWRTDQLDRGPDAPPQDPDVEIDEELVEVFVEEARKYVRKLEDTAPRFAAELDNEKAILDSRAVFHTMKGSSRTIELHEFGEFMYDMEKVFNAIRDNYIEGTAEIAEFLQAVTERIPCYIDAVMKGVPLYTSDFHIPHVIAEAIVEKRFDPDTMTVSLREESVPSSVHSIGTSALADAEVEEIELQEIDAPEELFAGEEATAGVVSASEQQIWSLDDADKMLEAVSIKFSENSQDEESQQNATNATLLMQALVPALVELREGGFLAIDDVTVGYFIDLSVIEQLASNSIFGLIDNGKGDFFKFPLNAETIAALERYLDALDEANTVAEGLSDVHAEVESFIRLALSLPQTDEFDLSEPGPEIEAELVAGQSEVEESPTAVDDAAPASPMVDGEGVVGEEPMDSESATATEEPPRPKPEADPEPGAVPGDKAAVIDTATEDIDLELLDLFIETLDEYLESIDGAVAMLGKGDAAGAQQLKNALHTMKGSAKSIGLQKFGDFVHDFESRVEELEHEGDIASADAAADIYAMVESLQQGATFIRQRHRDWDNSQPEANEPEQGQSIVAEDGPGEATVDEAVELPLKRVESLRVSTSRIDRLLDMGLEISMSNVRGRRALDAAQQDHQEVQSLARRVQSLVDKLSLQLDTEIQAKTEASDGRQFDPLEMDRITEKQSLAAILREAAYDLEEESRELGENIDTAMREAVGSGRLVDGNQSEMRLLRLVSFSKLGPGFRRLVHQVSRQLDKQVEFEINCEEGGLDVSVFEQVKTALEHMLRNAIDHGIDTPDERERRGKTPVGNVSLTISRRASEFVIRLTDDGNGIDPDVLRDKAIERGLIPHRDVLSEEEALRLIFRSGLSTADAVTDISGRGVGMDVVYQAITQVGGFIDVQSKPGFYTQFDIRIPASIMVNGALLARIGEEEVAVPLTSLDGSDFRRRDEVCRESARGPDGRLKFRDMDYELRYLGVVRGTLAPPPEETMPEFVPVLFAHHGQRRVAFYVDAVTNAEELVIRSLGAQFTSVPGIAGGSLKSDGQPVLALDLNELIQQVDYADKQADATASTPQKRILVLCVDDSVMMRRTYEKRLASLNYDVVTAVDGEDAMDYLLQAQRLPDFIFTDLEMPKMNGFDFIANLRRTPAMEKIATVVVSSRDGEKHRAEAQSVGATDFMAKGANTAEGMQSMIERHLSNTALAS